MSDDARPPIGDVVREIVRASAATVVDTRGAALADETDGVHRHRTAVRRVRSVLAAFAPPLDPAAARRVRVVFAEWGGQLGVVRDAEVRADAAAQALEKQQIADDGIRRRLVDDELMQYQRLHARLVELAEGERLAEADALLRDLAADPVLEGAEESARRALRRILRREVRRVRRAAKRQDGSVERLHEVRKAGRRLRYVGEAIGAATPLFADIVADLAAAGEAVHDLLGDHRDLVIFAERVERERARAARAGEPVAAYDALAAEARATADRRLEGLDDALARIRTAGRPLR
ncbi:CHAD domain-containing protein [Microbacterium sp. HA-8]|uniref:CHAD domain-containing protein n=1 Tax=Microbacterium sp. HA-8 TaxID=3234200 RepID=UPI0038F6E967